MAAVVLDCSAALSWFMPDEDEPNARELRTLVTDSGAVVPMLWPIEMGNIFVMAVRSGRISASDRAAAIAALGELPIEIDSETLTMIWTDTMVLADQHRLTVYDACYLDLAHRRHLPLATRDKELRAAARKLGVPILA
ncbi:MAG: type II toxin-antitoxin system VapC family toxin [Alphaproteobacteria bacterium]|nr:type II toxin-antitoxin system VapC family toxin [Alphaproteobacteria bacterium]